MRTRKVEEPSGGPFPIVGIGASAGGLEACSELLAHLPEQPGMAFVIVQHLDPRHPSILPELLSRATRIPVAQVSRDTRVLPDHVYVIPPNAALMIQDDVLRLEPLPDGPERRRPIDRFLVSLAEDRKSKAVGVILSGNAGDGTLGLTAIKSRGGITFAQDGTAKFDSMPRSAVAAGAVDFVLPPERIACELAAVAPHLSRNGSANVAIAGDALAFGKLVRILRDSTGVDFFQYRSAMVQERIARRMVLEKCATLSDYVESLARQPGNVSALFEDLLSGATEFFWDPAVFEALKSVGFPSILNDRAEGEPIRIWVPGCGAGEEVYSIAIALAEYLEAAERQFPFQIFGTDVSDAAITRARVGKYSGAAIANISRERLDRFFQEADSSYQVRRAIRNSCIFSRHNVLSDPPLGRMDLISCCNLLACFEPELQNRMARIYARSLRPGGLLVLGPSDDVGVLAHTFIAVDRDHRIYRRSGAVEPAFGLPARTASLATLQPQLPPPPAVPAILQAYANRMLVKQYAPSGLLVDRALRIVEVFGDVGPYLSSAAGRPRANLLKNNSDELTLHLRGAIEEAARTGAGIWLERVQLHAERRPRSVDIAVTPVMAPGAAPHFLVVFEEPHTKRTAGDAVRRGDAGPGSRARVARLEDELEHTRSYLQSIIEQLRSANEEIQASNEELLSTNEELQTAKEELQATNEELNTINDEMEGRNAELREANNDLLNLLSSMRIPTLMLSEDLRIRRFTPTSEQVLNLRATDIGRPVSDLKLRIDVPGLETIVHDVTQTLVPYERELRDPEGRWHVLRVRPYRTAENRIEGAVLQFLDVDQLKRSLEDARHARDYAEAIVDTIWEPLLVLDYQGRILTANPSFHETFRIPPGEASGHDIYEIGGGQWDFPKFHELLDAMRYGGSRPRDIEFEHTFERIGPRCLQVNARRIHQSGGTGLILLAVQDVTERKRAAEARYRQLFESAQDGILIVDAVSGEVTDINPFVLALVGCSRDEVVGKKFVEIAPLRDTPDAESSLERVRAEGVVRFPEWPLQASDGRNITAEVIGNAYRESDREMIQFNIRDITQRKKFETQLQHTQKLESLGLLAGGIAHDFNNLLTGIMGNASLGVVETPANASVRKYFRDIIRSSERAADLTRQMLAYAGKGRFVVQPLNVSSLIRDVGSLIRTSISKQVDLRLELAADLPRVEADSAQLQQLLMNLVINGAEAIGDQPGTLSVRTRVCQISPDFVQEYPPGETIPPGRYVCIEVTDTGAGMDDATKARIFDPFFTTKFTGRGLGLAAAVGIVRSHKGAMRVFSTPGHGSTFEVFLPVSEAAPPAVRPHTLENLRGSGTILFVDDEEVLRGLARNALELYGYHVLLAENGKVAVDMFHENPERISLVVLDMTMPVMGGKAALDRLKSIRSDIPVILSSGYDQSEAAAKFAGKDLAGFVQKPYPVEQLLQCIADVLRPQRQQR